MWPTDPADCGFVPEAPAPGQGGSPVDAADDAPLMDRVLATTDRAP
jgi:hypothetical protein